MTANVTLSVIPFANETWTITLDGDEYSYVVGTIDNTTETLQTVAEQLADKVRANYRVTISGSGSTRTLQITNVSNSNSAASLLQLRDAMAVGQQWIVKLDNGLNSGTYSYTVTASDLLSWGTTDSAQRIGLAITLAQQINLLAAGYLATADGRMLVIVRKDGLDFTSSLSMIGTVAQVSVVSSDIDIDSSAQSLLLQAKLRTVGSFSTVSVDYDTNKSAYRVVFLNDPGAALQLVDGTTVTDLETSTDRLEQWVPASSLVAGTSIRLANVQRSGTVGVSRIFSFLGSSVAANDLWVLSLNDGQDSTFSVTATASDASATDPKASLVARIAAEINKDANLDQTVDGAYLLTRLYRYPMDL
jgi:hypothetical protein